MKMKPRIGQSRVLKAALNQLVMSAMTINASLGKNAAMITKRQGLCLQLVLS